MARRTRIVNGKVFAPERTCHTEITLEGDRVLAIGEPPDGPPSDVTLDADGDTITPGLVDALVHGGGGAEAMSGSVDAIRTIARSHAQFGTNALCIGTVAAPMPALAKALGAIAEVALQPSDDGARVLGAYVEGLFGAVDKRGAHPREHLTTPSIEVFEELWEASHATVRVLSYAPEEDAELRLTRHLAERSEALDNLVPAMGHTNATYDDARRSIDAGIRRATHLFNGMTGLHHRRPGAAEAALDDPRVHVEIIGDDVHVTPLWARLAMRLRSHAHVGLVTDAQGAAALLPEDVGNFYEPGPDPGVLVSRDGRGYYLRNGAVFLDPVEDFLTGSAIALQAAVGNATGWGASTEQAIAMATASPAENLGLTRKGHLAPASTPTSPPSMRTGMRAPSSSRAVSFATSSCPPARSRDLPRVTARRVGPPPQCDGPNTTRPRHGRRRLVRSGWSDSAGTDGAEVAGPSGLRNVLRRRFIRELAHERLVLRREIRRHGDQHVRQQVPVLAAPRRHPLTGKTQMLPGLGASGDVQHHRAVRRLDAHLSA